MINSKQHRGCGVKDPGTLGYRGWKTADFSHSVRTAHGAPPNVVLLGAPPPHSSCLEHRSLETGGKAPSTHDQEAPIS